MTIEDAIYQLLKNDSAVASMVSGRIFSGVIPQKIDRYPAIAYRCEGREVVRVLEGGCALVMERIHIFSVSKSDTGEASILDRYVSGRLDEFFGDVLDTNSPPNAISIQSILSVNPAHLYEFDDPTQSHQYLTSFQVHYLDPLREPLTSP